MKKAPTSQRRRRPPSTSEQPATGPKRGRGQSRGDHPPRAPSARQPQPTAGSQRKPTRPRLPHADRREPALRRDDSGPQGILGRYRPDLARLLAAAEAAPYRYGQVLEHLLRRPAQPLDQASAIPTELRRRLSEAGSSVLSVQAVRRAPDGTTKLLLQTGDASRIETVVMPYGNRVTICLSSQVGCAVGCAFCATGTMGFRRNLSAAEIVDQYRASALVLAVGQRIANVVYMGMGEPLLNLGAVLDSIAILTYPAGVGLGHRSLSVSTVGIPSGMVRLARAEPQVNLALSLHAADDSTRALLIPDGFRHPVSDILEAAWEHFAITGRKLLIEYVLIAGINDSVDDARRLAGLIRGHVVTVNLLAWNPMCRKETPAREAVGRPAHRRSAPGEAHGRPASDPARRDACGSAVGQPPPAWKFQPSSSAATAAFRAVLREARVEAVVRQSKGAGIEAACGQLAARDGSYEGAPVDQA